MNVMKKLNLINIQNWRRMRNIEIKVVIVLNVEIYIFCKKKTPGIIIIVLLIIIK